MSNILLDYFFPITVIEPTPQASTAFLKQVCVVVKKKAGGVDNVITACNNATEVAALTDNTEANQLFAAGMNKVYILTSATPDIATTLLGVDSFFTILISSDFSDAVIGGPGGITVASAKASKHIQNIVYTAKTAGAAGNSITIAYINDGVLGSETVSVSGSDISVHMVDSQTHASVIAGLINNSTPASALVGAVVDSGQSATAQAGVGATNLTGGLDQVLGGLDVGTFKGVVGLSSNDNSFLLKYAVVPNYATFHTTSGNKAKNMFYAFGKLLSNDVDWLNQQYIVLPVADDITSLGSAETLFDDKINFCLSDSQFGNRLALFAVGGKAIVAPYIEANLSIDLQSKALQYVSGNEPSFTIKNASLIEDELKKVIQGYIDRGWLSSGTVAVSLGDNTNFVALANLVVPEPTALWRIEGEMRQI